MTVANSFPAVQTAPGSVNIPIAPYPASTTSSSADANKVAADLTSSLNAAIEKKDYAAISNLFLEDGFWRDHLALTWDFHTIKAPAIQQFLEKAATSADGFRLKKVEVDASAAHRAPKVQGLGPGSCVHFFIRVETVLGQGPGLVQAVERDGKWKIFTLYTSLRELKGHEEGTYHRRPVGVKHGGIPGRTNWAERRQLAADYQDGSEPAVFILGELLSEHCRSLLVPHANPR